MAQISLLLDEDVRPLLAEILRQRGYDAVHVLDLERTGKTDAEQLEFAVSQQRSILTHNIRDFLGLDRHYRISGKRTLRHTTLRSSNAAGLTAKNITFPGTTQL